MLVLVIAGPVCGFVFDKDDGDDDDGGVVVPVRRHVVDGYEGGVRDGEMEGEAEMIEIRWSA